MVRRPILITSFGAVLLSLQTVQMSAQQPSVASRDAGRQLAYVPLNTVREGRVKMPAALARRVSVEVDQVPLQQALMQIANQAQLGLSYGEAVARSNTLVTVHRRR